MQRQLPSNRTRYDAAPVWCVALSEGETVFLDGNSLGAFLYDAKDRCVVTLPELHESKRFPVCVSVSSTGGEFGTRDDAIYVMDRSLGRPETPRSSSSIQLQALVHRMMHSHGTYLDNWRCDELPPPPYVASSGAHYFILSHALVGGASDVICVSTSEAGTYCFYTATRTWSKAGDWALSFEGKIERDVDLGVWIGFLHYRRKNEFQRLCVTGDLFSAADRRRVATLCRHDAAARLWADDGKDLEPPHGWYQDIFLPKIVSLGSGKFCLVQFFETREEVCREEVVDRFAEIYSDYEEEICGHYGPPAGEVVDKFAVFTGVEVVRGRGGGGKDGPWR